MRLWRGAKGPRGNGAEWNERKLWRHNALWPRRAAHCRTSLHTAATPAACCHYRLLVETVIILLTQNDDGVKLSNIILNIDGGRPLHLRLSDPPLLLCLRPPSWIIRPLLASCCSLLDCHTLSAPLSHCVIHSLMTVVSSTAGSPCIACHQIAPHRPPPTCLASSTAAQEEHKVSHFCHH